MSADSDSLKHYRENLKHVVRPEEKRDRKESRRVEMANWEALVLVEGLREYAAYEAPSVTAEEIALAYIEYIHMVVHDERREHLSLYAHTDDARDVLVSAASCLSNAEVRRFIVSYMKFRLFE